MVELLLAVVILRVVFSMTAVIESTFLVQLANTLQIGQATEAGQTGLAQVDQFLRNAVPPVSVDAAPPAVTSACWGSVSLAAAPSNGGINAGTLGAPRALSPSQSTSLSVVVAHDFDVWFCSYHSVSPTSPPGLYEVRLGTAAGAPCVNAGNEIGGGAKNQGGYCTLQVVYWGANCDPGTGAGTSSCTLAVVDSVPDVFCEVSCQGGSVNKASVAVDEHQAGSVFPSTVTVACRDWGSNTAASCAKRGATPPLFSYCAGVDGGTCHSSATCSNTPVNAAACSVTTCTLPAPCTGNCGGALDLSSVASPDAGAAPVPPALTVLAGVSLVRVRLTVLTAKNTATPVVGGQPGVHLTNQVFLQNAAASGGACRYDSVLVSDFTPVDYWEMNDNSSASSQVGSVVDVGSADQAGTAAGSVTGSTVGMLPCLPSSPSYTFSGSGYITTQGACSTDQGFSLSGWFVTKSQGGIIGCHGSYGYDRFVWVDGSGHLVWGVCTGSTQPQSGNCVAELTTLQTVADGQPHFCVATIGPTGMQLYLDGALAASNAAVTQAQAGCGGASWGSWTIGELPASGGWPDTPGGNPYPFSGEIGRVGVFANVPSPTDVQQLYAAAGSSSACYASTVGAPVTHGANLLGYWPMTQTSQLTDQAPQQPLVGKVQADNATASAGVSYTPGSPVPCHPAFQSASLNGGTHLNVGQRSAPVSLYRIYNPAMAGRTGGTSVNGPLATFACPGVAQPVPGGTPIDGTVAVTPTGAPGTDNVTVVVHNLLPNQTYTVAQSCAKFLSGSLTTNAQGSATATFVDTGVVPGQRLGFDVDLGGGGSAVDATSLVAPSGTNQSNTPLTVEAWVDFASLLDNPGSWPMPTPTRTARASSSWSPPGGPVEAF